MFIHSVAVPRIYKVSAQILQKVVEEEASLKELVYGKKKHPNVKAIYSLLVTSLKKANELGIIFDKLELIEKEPRLNPWLAKILITELLWGKKRLAGDSKPIKTILSYEQAIKEYEADNISATETPLKVVKPRYVRVNTILSSTKEVIDGFREEGWTLVQCFDNRNYDGFLEKVSSLTEYQFMIDIHVPSLLIFPPRTEFFCHEAYKTAKILLQDKASCLPAQLLNPEPGSVVLDMCAAPGMKTTQIAALMKNKGTLYAVERDERRYEVLKDMVKKAGATCVKSFNEDVLSCDSNTFPNVDYILVDPSCSGSGMTDRPDFEKEANLSRLDKLAAFQVKILRHALLKFPQVKRVVYSTCSIHPQENEDVVRQVLETNYNFKLVNAKKYLNNAWKNFGDSSFGELGKYCLYAKPTEDLSNGFFVAVFEKLEEGEENPFFDNKVFNYKKKEEFRRKTKLKYEAKRENNREMDVEEENTDERNGEVQSVENKKKRKKEKESADVENTEEHNETVEEQVPKKKKKKKLKEAEELESIEISTDVGNIKEETEIVEEEVPKKKEKKKQKNVEKPESFETLQPKEKKKKRKYQEESESV